MKSYPSRFAMILVAVILGGLGTPYRTVCQDARISIEINQQFDSLAAAIRRLDIDRIIGTYSADSGLVRVIDGRVIRGFQHVSTDFRRGFGIVRSVERLSIGERHLVRLDSTTARLVVRLNEAYTDTAGHRIALRGTWTSVWRRRGQSWKIIADTAIHTLDGRQTHKE